MHVAVETQGTLRGIISCHVDDFLFSGGQQDQEWEALLKTIREKYAWGEWESKKFVQCGVLIEEQSDNSYHLSQPSYMDKVHEIPLSASRRKDKDRTLTSREHTQLRAALGALSWHAQQVAPHFAAEVGLFCQKLQKGQWRQSSKPTN
jgi:hypothetical protein